MFVLISCDIETPTNSTTAESSINSEIKNTPDTTTEPTAEPTTTTTEPAAATNVITTAETQPPIADDNPITLVSLTSPIAVNNTAAIKIKGKPNTEYNIMVYYKSGPSKADGLYSKTSDSNGYVSWSWDIGPKTSDGTFKITITGGGENFETQITITK